MGVVDSFFYNKRADELMHDKHKLVRTIDQLHKYHSDTAFETIAQKQTISLLLRSHG